MKNLQFLNYPESYGPDEAFVAHLSSVGSEEELFKQLSEKLKFPSYFGFNWNAVYDCLTDLDWIEQKRIVIVHDDVPSLSDKEFSTYLRVLDDAVDDWKEGDDHSLQVFFPESSRTLMH